MKTPSAGLYRRALMAVFGTASVSIGAFLLLHSPALQPLLDSFPALATETGAAIPALLAGFIAGTILASLLFREPDRTAALALAALQGDDPAADDSEAGDEPEGDLRLVATRFSEWRLRARQSDLAHRRLEETLVRLAGSIEEMSIDGMHPIRAEGDPGVSERSLIRAVNGLLESAKRFRDTAAVLLARIEEDLEQAVEPLEDAGRRMTGACAALDRSLVTMSRALALVVRAEEAEPNGKSGWPGELGPVKQHLQEAVRESYEARFSLEQCFTAMDRAQRAGGHVEREVSAVRKRFGGADVKHLSEGDFMPENGTEQMDTEKEE